VYRGGTRSWPQELGDGLGAWVVLLVVPNRSSASATLRGATIVIFHRSPILRFLHCCNNGAGSNHCIASPILYGVPTKSYQQWMPTSGEQRCPAHVGRFSTLFINQVRGATSVLFHPFTTAYQLKHTKQM